MSKNWIKIIYFILHIVCVFISILFIGIAGEYSKVGEYKEILFILGAVINTIPFMFLWLCFLIYCIKNSIKGDTKMSEAVLISRIKEMRCGLKTIGEVDQLKQQLAESKEQLIAMNEKSNKIKKESYYLKQQLADKEKEIEWYKEVQRDWHKSDTVTQKIFNQTAIAELEKVIKFMKTRDEWGFFPEQINIAEFIEQQIRVLKGE